MVRQQRQSMVLLTISSLLFMMGARSGEASRPPPTYMPRAQCSSGINTTDKDGKKLCCDNHVDINPGLRFHWTYHKGQKSSATSHSNATNTTHDDDATEASTFAGALEYHMTYERNHWLGIGFSPDGSMAGSRAVVGLLGTGVKLYDLSAKDASGGIAEYDKSTRENDPRHTYSSGYMTPQGNMTMHFQLNQFEDFVPEGSNNDNIMTMIFAIGTSNTLGYHEHRGSFRLDIENCPPRSDPFMGKTRPSNAGAGTASTSTSSSSSNEQQALLNHKTAFAAHGFFALLAFLVVIPMALISAWFRTLIPRWWVYVHVVCNGMSAFLVTISIAAAFGGMVLRSEDGGEVGHNYSGHMTIPHHWLGLSLFLILLFQVISGFLRPPVPSKGEAGNTRSCCCGLIPLQSPRRDVWQRFHYITAFFIIGMSLYQMQSGLKIFISEYGGDIQTSIIVFWGWIAFLVFLLFVIKCCCGKRRKKKGGLRSTRNIMPQRSEEDDDDDLPRSQYRDDEKQQNDFNRNII